MVIDINRIVGFVKEYPIWSTYIGSMVCFVLPAGQSLYQVDLQNLVDAIDAKHEITARDDGKSNYLEEIISWFVESDDYKSQFERDQLEFDGKITYPAKVLSL